MPTHLSSSVGGAAGWVGASKWTTLASKLQDGPSVVRLVSTHPWPCMAMHTYLLAYLATCLLAYLVTCLPVAVHGDGREADQAGWMYRVDLRK